MFETTPIIKTKEIDAIQSNFDKIIAVDPKVKTFTLNKKQFQIYFEQVMPHARLLLSGNPQYKGREIKKQ